jgi:predicted DNA-binding protein with PD1-like motif
MPSKIHVFRIKPDQELIAEIYRYCNEHNISSGIITGIIGSLKNATLSYLLKLPGKYEAVDYNGPLELVCAQGSIALKDSTPIVHIHAQLSNQKGCYGGHLVLAVVFSTAEVSIAELDYPLKRQLDTYTGNNELIN